MTASVDSMKKEANVEKGVDEKIRAARERYLARKGKNP